ncbi:MAG TPA: ATP-binding protein [Candidatus Acidoferrales bacterium]|nr:ATP-binding protein [Candidatus Acidoferrales bacterium]
MYSLFDGLKDAEVKELLTSASEEKMDAGLTVIKEGEIVQSLYVLKSGSVQVAKLIDEKEEMICVLGNGDFFGESSVADGKNELRASASVTAAESSVVLQFSKKTFLSLMQRFPRITWNMARALSDRLSASNNTLKKQIESHHQISKKEITKLNALIEATQTVNSSLELDKVLQMILDEAIRITEAERGTIYLVDENAKEIWSKILVGGELSEVRQPIGKGISGYVAETGESVSIKDAYNDLRFNPEFDRRTGFKTTNMLCVPMRNRDNKIIGVFQLLNKRGEEFDTDDERFLKAFSIHASIAIENSRLASEMVKAERLSAVGKMAGSVIHDIKNPMSAIKLYAQVLKKKAHDEESANLVDEITTQIDRLVKMAQEVLDFSRGVSQMNIQRVKFNDFLKGVLWFLKSDFEYRKINLVNESSYAGDIEIDPDKMTRVILNIAGNAADAMPDGGSFSVRSRSDADCLVIELQDTGSGMPEEIRKTIFEPFVTYGKKHGTGLGMAIVKKIIDDHHGEIKIESRIGIGTKMTIRLPLIQPN